MGNVASQAGVGIDKEIWALVGRLGVSLREGKFRLGTQGSSEEVDFEQKSECVHWWG